MAKKTTPPETPGKVEATDESASGQEDISQTVQTVQPQSAERKPFFEIAKDPEDGLYHWQLWSGNGRPMAQSAIGYNALNDAKNAIQSFNGQLGKQTKIVVAHE